MKMLTVIFTLLLSVITFSSTAKQITVFYEAAIVFSDTYDMQPNDIITGSFTYESTTPGQLTDQTGIFFDRSATSIIIANLPNGDTYTTSPEATDRVDIYGGRGELSAGGHRFATNVESQMFSSSDGVYSGFFTLSVAEIVPQSPENLLRTVWPEDINVYVNNELDIMTDGVSVNARLTKISAVSTSPVEVLASSDDEPVPASGGRLYLTRDITNTSTEIQVIKRWANITWADGTQYNRNSPSSITLAPQEQSIQTNAYFDVPAYWPAGAYTYSIYSITTQDGLVSQDSFVFTKEE